MGRGGIRIRPPRPSGASACPLINIYSAQPKRALSEEVEMALLRKGSRFIVVDGCRFRWRVRHKTTYSQGLCWSGLILAVDVAEKKGAILVVRVPQLHPSNWLREATRPLLPAQVSHYIRQALISGWQPTVQGKPFHLTLR